MFHRKIWWFYDWLSEMRAPLKASNGLVVIFRSPAFWRRGGREDIKHFNSSEYQRIFDWTQSQNQNHQTSKESRNSPCYWWFWISDKFLYCGPLQRLKGRGQKKKRDYVGKFPNWGGGVWPKPTSWCLFTKLFLACQNDSEVLKHVLQKGGRWYLINFNT